MSTGSLLDWPGEFERTPENERGSGSKFDVGLRKTKREIKKEMEGFMEVDQWRIEDVSGSSGDPGVVLRWTKNEQDFVVACDAYKSKSANARAVYLWIKETRKRGDRPVKTGGSEFAAARLPPGDGDAITVDPKTPPHEVLGVRPDARDEVINAAFKAAVKEAHSDTASDGPGSRHTVQELKEARDEMLGGE